MLNSIFQTYICSALISVLSILLISPFFPSYLPLPYLSTSVFLLSHPLFLPLVRFFRQYRHHDFTRHHRTISICRSESFSPEDRPLRYLYILISFPVPPGQLAHLLRNSNTSIFFSHSICYSPRSYTVQNGLLNICMSLHVTTHIPVV